MCVCVSFMIFPFVSHKVHQTARARSTAHLLQHSAYRGEQTNLEVCQLDPGKKCKKYSQEMNWISLISLNMTESNQVSYTINKPLDYVGFTFQPMLPQRFPALGQLVRLGFTRSPGLVSCLMSWAVKVQVSSQQKRGLQ